MVGPPTPATLRRYHLTEDDWWLLYEAQDEACAICHQPAKTSFVIDHDHRSGRVRGLIHPMCNGKLGKIKDSAIWARQAAAYLDNPPAYRLLTTESGWVTMKPRGRNRRTRKP